MPSPLPPEVEDALDKLAEVWPISEHIDSPNAAAMFEGSVCPILHRLYLLAQVAQAEEDMNAVCDKRPSSRHGQYRGGDRRSRGCPAWKIHDRLASLRAQLQEIANAPR